MPTPDLVPPPSRHGGYGLRWQPPDPRDFRLAAPPPEDLLALPVSVDLEPGMPPVWNQGSLGACTAFACGAAHMFEQIKQGPPDDFTPSFLAIYYAERELEGTTEDDAGAFIRDGMKVLSHRGACPEALWPYAEARYRDAPPLECWTAAMASRATAYYAVPNAEHSVKHCLASGYPIVVGITVYESFESVVVAKTGIVDLPGPDEAVLGGHAVLCCGYDDRTGRYKIRNSWSASWGLNGYFTLPYAYLNNASLASDFWTLRKLG